MLSWTALGEKWCESISTQPSDVYLTSDSGLAAWSSDRVKMSEPWWAVQLRPSSHVQGCSQGQQPYIHLCCLVQHISEGGRVGLVVCRDKMYWAGESCILNWTSCTKWFSTNACSVLHIWRRGAVVFNALKMMLLHGWEHRVKSTSRWRCSHVLQLFQRWKQKNCMQITF